MDFGDLKDDTAIQAKLQNFNKSVNDIEQILDVAFNSNISEDISMQDKLNYDLFIAYTLNTLYWLYLRSRGIDPNDNDVKLQLQRVREYMLKAKSAIERHTLRKKVNVDVAERFVRHELHIPKERKLHDSDKSTTQEPPSKRRKNNKNK